MTERLVRVVVPAERVEEKVVAPATASVPKEADWEKRLVEDAVVAKLAVEVEKVEVEVSEVKSLKVVEPERRRFESEVSPAVAERVPVKLAADEIV